MKSINKKINLAIIGLGYVGLPLALEFAKKRPVIGFDIDKNRVKELKLGNDKNLESNLEEFQNAKQLVFTNIINDLKSANCYIITVPTPINKLKKPDLKPLFSASKTVSKVIKKGDIVIYESTVYPGCIEEQCIPIIQKYSKLKYNRDFFCGYSPERINPGDKEHTISKIKKITSGSTANVAEIVNSLYKEIVIVGTYKAPSIKVAEAAKVIENTQRDLNIALINELSTLFNKMNIDTQEVLEAASSKWNFLPFKPGLVGGHCIGVDPYYLTFKAESIGHTPKIILAGREINAHMGNYVVKQLIKKMKEKFIKIKNAKILIMGLTFKENCADIRNSGIERVISELKKYKCKLDLYDSLADQKKIKQKHNIIPNSTLKKNSYDAILIAVAHNEFKEMGYKKINNLGKKKKVIYDLKCLFSKDQVDLRL